MSNAFFDRIFPVRNFSQNEVEYPPQAYFKDPVGPSYLGKNGWETPDKNLVRYDQIDHIFPGLFPEYITEYKIALNATEPIYLNGNALLNWKRFVTDCYKITDQVIIIRQGSGWVNIRTSIVLFKSNYQSNFPDYMKNISTYLKSIYFKEDINNRNKCTLHLANLNAKMPPQITADNKGVLISSGQIVGVPPIAGLHKDVIDYHQISYPNKNFLGNEYIKYWFPDANIGSGKWYYRKLGQPASASPGTSSHGWGTSLNIDDLSIKRMVKYEEKIISHNLAQPEFPEDTNFKWITSNIESYGWSAEAGIDPNNSNDRYHLNYFKSDGPLYKGRPQDQKPTTNYKIILAKGALQRN